MATNKRDWAVVLPSFDYAGYAKQIRAEEQDRIEKANQLRREKMTQQNMMLDYLERKLKESNYNTKTDFDDYFNKEISKILELYTSAIINGNIDYANLHYQLGKKASQLGDASKQINAFREGIEEVVKEKSKELGYRPTLLKQEALRRYAFDDKGNLRTNFNDLPKDPYEFISSIISQDPSKFLDESKVEENMMKRFDSQKYSDGREITIGSRRGVNGKTTSSTRTERLDGTYHPFQTLVYNSKGQVEEDEYGNPKVKVKDQPIKDASGNVIGTEISDVVWHDFIKNDENKAWLDIQFKKHNDQLEIAGLKRIPEDDIDVIGFKKMLLYNYLNTKPPIKNTYQTRQYNTFITKPESEPKSDKFSETHAGRVYGLLNGNVTQGTLDGLQKEGGLIDVTGYVGDVKNKNGVKYNKVLYDPVNKKINFKSIDDTDNQELSNDNVDLKNYNSFFSNISGVNNIKIGDLNKVGGATQGESDQAVTNKDEDSFANRMKKLQGKKK